MKKLLLLFGIISVMVVAGCSQSDSGEEEASDNSSTEENQTNEDQTDSTQVKKDVLNAQRDFTSTISPYQQKINAYQASLADEEAAEEDTQAAAEEALTAAKDAQTELEGYEFSTDLPEDVEEKYNSALSSLSEYYAEMHSAIEESALDPDFSNAEAKWEEFQTQINELYEGIDMHAPNMGDALS
ncbi:hypothetical protein [Sediminibacillus massiliensis]|uniref:hypothetical protein n=1 Tax=Sediminibacillus massiliensis TaxID=1926277 RepID=UPI000988532E|nr:hypothetical protein [Sediminibacillus massiliensis]